MDTARLCMWFDLQLGPHYAAKRGMAALVWDNCGPHGTAAVREMAEEWGITLLPLPKNMTDVLQVMDLVVNSPVKAALRRDRERLLSHQFHTVRSSISIFPRRKQMEALRGADKPTARLPRQI